MNALEPPRTGMFWRTALAGSCATACGIGLSRFAFVPLFPAMVLAGWLDGPQGGLLGAANFIGYLLGATSGHRLARATGPFRAFNLAMGSSALAFLACAWNGGLGWFLWWRFLAGVSGGILMTVAGPAVQAAVDPTRQGLGSGVVTGGVGAGIVVSSVAVPSLLGYGVAYVWIILSLIVLCFWFYGHLYWPKENSISISPPKDYLDVRAPLLLYALSGAGMVPHMVYLADFAVRTHNFEAVDAGAMWSLFGLGAIGGTVLGGRASDRFGGSLATRMWLVFQVVALCLVLLNSKLALMAGGFLGGFAGIGISAVMVAWARQLAGQAAGSLWGKATAAYALAQAVCASLLSGLFAQYNSHHLIFGIGLFLSILVCALSLGLSIPRRSPPASSTPGLDGV